MPRVARIVIPGWPHHVVQRGNNRQDVFFVDDDCRAYLRFLCDQSARFGIHILGYCLMSNHVHIIAVPDGEDSLAKAIGRTHFLYAQYVNRVHGRSGHLWQNRFYSCALDDLHLWRALRYVERNPVRAKMVRVAWRHTWSSAAAHTGEKDLAGLLDLAAWSKEWKADAWRAALSDADNEEEVHGLRCSTSRGRPLARDSLLSKLEHKLGRRLRPLPVGRPRKPDRSTEARARKNAKARRVGQK